MMTAMAPAFRVASNATVTARSHLNSYRARGWDSSEMRTTLADVSRVDLP